MSRARYSRQRGDGWKHPRLGRLYTSVVVDQMSGLGHPEYGDNSSVYTRALYKLPPLLDPALVLQGGASWIGVPGCGAIMWWQGAYPYPL